MIIEENSDIFVAGGDALVHLAGTMHAKYFTTFVWGYQFSAYIFYDRSFTPTPPTPQPPSSLLCSLLYTFVSI